MYDDKGNIISGNKTVTKETEFIKKAKELGFRWGGEFTKPDKIHIDAWPKGETKKHGYDSWSEAYKENQKDYRDGTYTKETYEYDKPVETKESETPVETEETPAASGG